jgi:hypothetical protein
MMARDLFGLAALLIAVTIMSPAHSATLMNNAIRVSPALQFHPSSPSVEFAEKHSMHDISITKHVDVATPKLMTRTAPKPVPIPYPATGAVR